MKWSHIRQFIGGVILVGVFVWSYFDPPSGPWYGRAFVALGGLALLLPVD
jgi:hypothetical protein